MPLTEYKDSESSWLDSDNLSGRSHDSDGWSNDLHTSDRLPKMMSITHSDDSDERYELLKRPWNDRSHLIKSTPERKNYTFTDQQMWEIERTNSFLMGQILRAKPAKSTTLAKTQSNPTSIASAAVNRRKNDVEINRVNAVFLDRLKSISRKNTKSFN